MIMSCFCLLEPDKLQFGDVILNVDAVRVIVVKNHSPKHVHVKFKVNTISFFYGRYLMYHQHLTVLLKCIFDYINAF